MENQEKTVEEMSQQERNQRFLDLCAEADQLAAASGWGDWCGYNRVRELVSNIFLDLNMPQKYAGPDGIDSEGNGVEHKSTIAEEIKGNYRGLSYDEDFQVQREIVEKKILKLPKHYYTRFKRNSTEIEEVWELDAEKVVDLIIPKLEKQHPGLRGKRDPRPSACVTKKEITTFGRKLL